MKIRPAILVAGPGADIPIALGTGLPIALPRVSRLEHRLKATLFSACGQLFRFPDPNSKE